MLNIMEFLVLNIFPKLRFNNDFEVNIINIHKENLYSDNYLLH